MKVVETGFLHICVATGLGLWGLGSMARLLAASDVNRSAVTSSIRHSSTRQYALAAQQSFGFFTDITDAEWKLRQDYARRLSRHNHFYEEEPLEHADTWNLWYLLNYEPIFSCPLELRVGGLGDGPKWVCDPHRLPIDHCLIYSVGSNGQYEFEDGIADIAKRTGRCQESLEIHTFDMGAYERSDRSYVHYHQWGIKGAASADGTKFVSFTETQQRLNHTDRTIDIFKIDCEGCEWDSYSEWIQADIRQLQVETHRVPKDKTLEFFDQLQANNYIMFHKEGNMHPRAHGCCVEFAYIRLDNEFLHGGGVDEEAEEEESESESEG